jgi:hypothetical protein
VPTDDDDTEAERRHHALWMQDQIVYALAALRPRWGEGVYERFRRYEREEGWEYGGDETRSGKDRRCPAPQPAPSLDAWLEEPRTGAETRTEAARRLSEIASRLGSEDREWVAFASGLLSGPQPAPDSPHGEKEGSVSASPAERLTSPSTMRAPEAGEVERALAELGQEVEAVRAYLVSEDLPNAASILVEKYEAVRRAARPAPVTITEEA